MTTQVREGSKKREETYRGASLKRIKKDEMGFVRRQPTLMENFFSALFYIAFSITD
jgi:uncharacterized membrane protein (DUF106 family)